MSLACCKMYKYIILVLSLKIIAISGYKSFTVVLDTTVSMSDEINVIKANIGQVVTTINRTDIENYILVPFKDILVESPYITESPRYFSSHLNTITTSGGSDCPENSLAGIEAALWASKKESYIFVFTDAYAKDYNRFQSIKSLCRERHSQVIIFLSGFCLPSKTSAIGNVDVYYDVAKACSGGFFQFNTTYDLRQAFTYMKKVINTDWTDITPQEVFTNHKQLSFSVNSFTTDFLIGVSGINPSLTILDPNSQHLQSTEKVLLTRHALVVHLHEPGPGEYSVSILGEGTIYVTFYERNYIPFQYGFSTKMPRSLKETSLRPLEGWTNYIFISIDTSIKLELIEWLNAGDTDKKVLYLEEKRPGLYITHNFVEPGKTFRIWVIGQDTYTRENIKASTKYIFPQASVANGTSTRPEVEILDPEVILIDYETDLTLACKVTGFPKSNIRWEDNDGSVFPSEDVLLEIPTVYISYVTITKVTENSTIYCKSENTNGDASEIIHVFVNRPFSFEVKETPTDTTVEYGNDLTLPCQVTAYPEATVKWYFNSSKIGIFSNPKATIEENTLTIRNVSLDNGGIYDCIASNEVETKTFSAIVNISGLEAPEVKTNENEIVAKPDEWIDIDCSVTRGKPAPILTWQYKSFEGYDFGDLPFGVTVEDGNIKISSANNHHSGVYKCTASNILGQNDIDVTVKIQYAPIIKNNLLETQTVKEGDSLQLMCEVEAIPEASVRWEMSQDDVSIILDKRHRVDDQHKLYFTAFWNDSGNYHCIAENNIGRAERTVKVNVLVSPYIETPKSKTFVSKVGGQVHLACNVLYGSPAPIIKWEFIATDSTSSILTTKSSTLHLTNVTQSDEGSYLCIAENQIGVDRIKYILNVHQ